MLGDLNDCKCISDRKHVQYIYLHGWLVFTLNACIFDVYLYEQPICLVGLEYLPT